MSQKISIHAPARGATEFPDFVLERLKDFNPRSRKGSDPDTEKIRTLLAEFQSTLPQGERLKNESGIWWAATISIHAPARGATARREFVR